jgi:hypothetical protein
MMIVQQAKNIIRQWVIDETSQSPGFHGAFLHGSINRLYEEAALPSTQDCLTLARLFTKRRD